MAAPATTRAGTYTDDYVHNTLASLEIMPLPQLRAFWAERWGTLPAYRTRETHGRDFIGPGYVHQAKSGLRPRLLDAVILAGRPISES